MGSSEQSEPKERSFGGAISCIVGAGVWWFLSSQPSVIALLLATILLVYLFLGFCLIAVLLPGPDTPTRKEAFVPVPQSEMERPKALTF